MICPGCEKEIKILNEYLGLKIECTICGKKFKARVLDDEKRRAQRAQRAKAARKAAEARKALADERQQCAKEKGDDILKSSAHGAVSDQVAQPRIVDDLLDAPQARAPESAPATKGERDFHLITVRGKPIWVVLTVGAAAISLFAFLSRPGEFSFERWRASANEAGYFEMGTEFHEEVLRGRRVAIRYFARDVNNPDKGLVGLCCSLDDREHIIAVTVSYLHKSGDEDYLTVLSRKQAAQHLIYDLTQVRVSSIKLGAASEGIREGFRRTNHGWIVEVIEGADSTMLLARKW